MSYGKLIHIMKLKKIELQPKSCYIVAEEYLIDNFHDIVTLSVENIVSSTILYVFNWLHINALIEESTMDNLL